MPVTRKLTSGDVVFNLLGKRRPGVVQALREIRVIHRSRLVDCGVILVGEHDLRIAYFNLTDILFLYHLHKCSVVNLHDLTLHKNR